MKVRLLCCWLLLLITVVQFPLVQSQASPAAAGPAGTGTLAEAGAELWAAGPSEKAAALPPAAPLYSGGQAVDDYVFAALFDRGDPKSGNGVARWDGSAWELANSGLSGDALIVREIVVDPFNPTTLFIATYDGVYKTTDAIGSCAWDPVYVSPGVRLDKVTLSVAADPTTQGVFYAGTEYIGGEGVFIYKTTDGGDTWTQISLPPTGGTWDWDDGVSDIHVGDENGGQYVYAANRYKENSPKSYWRSTDGGQGFARIIVTQPSQSVISAPGDDSVVYLAYPSHSAELYKSTDFGITSTWFVDTPTSPPNRWFEDLAITDFSNAPSQMWIPTSDLHTDGQIAFSSYPPTPSSWTWLDTPGNPMSIDFKTPGEAWVGARNGYYLVLSSDDYENWNWTGYQMPADVHAGKHVEDIVTLGRYFYDLREKTFAQVEVSPAITAADGIATSVLTVTVYNYTGTLSNKSVTLTTDASANVTLTQPLDPTDQNGQTVGYIQCDIDKVVQISATGDVDLSNLVRVVFVGPDLAVAQQAAPIVPAGALMTYTLWVTNSGLVTATSVLLTDTLPACVEYLGTSRPGGLSQTDNVLVWEVGSMLPGEALSWTVTVQVSGTLLVNTVEAQTTPLEHSYANNSSSEETLALGYLVPDPADPALGVAQLRSETLAVALENRGEDTLHSMAVLTMPLAMEGWLQGSVSGGDSVAPGAEATLVITASPSGGVDTGYYQGYVVVGAQEGTEAYLGLTVYVAPGVSGTALFTITEELSGSGVPARMTLVRPGSTAANTDTLVFQDRADPSGTLSFSGLPTGTYYYLAGGVAGLDNSWGWFEVEGGGSAEINVVMPLASIWYEWWVKEGSITDTYDIILDIIYRLEAPPRMVPCGPWHEFTLEGDPGITHSGSIEVKNASNYEALSVTVRAGDNLQGITLTFAAEGQMGTVISRSNETIVFTATKTEAFSANHEAGDILVEGWYYSGSERLPFSNTITFLTNPEPTITCSCETDPAVYRTHCVREGGGGIPLPPGPGPWQPLPSVSGTLQLRLSQQAMLSRQAFWADLVIHNEGPTKLSNVAIDLAIEDGGGGLVTSSFFTDTSQAQWTTVPAYGSRAWHWTIIPGACLGGTEESGLPYKVSAEATYDIGPLHDDFSTTKTGITVYPQPRVYLSYYLPDRVEANQPWHMLIAAHNHAYGAARNLQMSSPEVVPDVFTEISQSLKLGTIPPQGVGTGFVSYVSTGWSGEVETAYIELSHRDYNGIALNPLILRASVYTISSEGVFLVDVATLDDPVGDSCAPDPTPPPTPTLPWVEAPSDTMVLAGELVTLDFSVRNLGNDTLTATLRAKSSQGWAVGVGEGVVIEPQGVVQVAVVLSVPLSAQPGAADGVTLWATAENGGYDYDTVHLLVDHPLPDDQCNSEVPACNINGTCKGLHHRGGGAIDTYNGNHTYVSSDLEVPVAGGTLEFRRVYASQFADSETSLGYGWSHNYAMRVLLPADPGGEEGFAIVVAPDGSRLRFFDDGQGGYTPYPGVQGTLDRQGSAPAYSYVLTGTNQSVYSFDSAGYLSSMRNPQGHETTLSYTSTAGCTLPLTVTGYCAAPCQARYLAFSYDTGSCQLLKVRDHTGRGITFTYDLEGDLVRMTDTRGYSWTYTYANGHLLNEVLDPQGHLVEKTAYDDQGRGQQQWLGGASEPTLEIEYGSGNERVVTDGRGLALTVYYDYRGVWVGTSNSLGGETTHSFDDGFNMTSIADANGSTTELAWSACGCMPTVVTDTLGHTTRVEYDENNHPLELIDAEGGHTTRSYEGNNLTSSTDALNRTTSYTYSQSLYRVPDNLLVEQESPGGSRVYYSYDEHGQLIRRVELAAGQRVTTTYGYDELGRTISTTRAVGTPYERTTLNYYDPGGHLVRTVENCSAGSYASCQAVSYDVGAPDENVTSDYVYDPAGRRTHTIDALGVVSYREYDEEGRLLRAVENYDPGKDPNEDNLYNISTWYGYDENGNQVLVTDTYGMVVKTEYDPLNRVIATTRGYTTTDSPLYNLSTRYGYDLAGRRVVQADARGVKMTTSYDGLGQIVATTRNYDPFIARPTGYIDSDVGGPAGYYSWLEASGATTYTLPAGTEQVAIPLPPGQSFSYYGNSYTSLWATRYGYLYFGDQTDPISYTLAGTPAIPAPAGPNNVVAPLWSDGQAGQAVTVRASSASDPLSGDALFVVEYLDYYAGTACSAPARFQVVLNLDRRSLLFQYRELSLGGEVVGIGIEDGTGLAGVGYYGSGQPAENAPHERLAVLFTEFPSSEGNVTSYYGYDKVGNQTVVTDALGIITMKEYDLLGRLIAETVNYTSTSPAGPAYNLCTTYAYRADGRRMTVTNPLQVKTVTELDAFGRTTRQVQNYQDGSYSELAPDEDVYSEYFYDPSGHRTAVVVLGAYTTSYGYDAQGRTWTISDPEGGTITRTYGVMGRLAGTSDANGNTTSYGYDLLGRQVAVTDALGNVTQHSYDALGREILVSNAGGVVTRQEYDLLGRLIATTRNYVPGQPADAQTNLRTAYGYDRSGRQVTLTNALGMVNLQAYDALGRLVAETGNYTSTPGADPSLYNFQSRYAHNALGRRTVVTDAAGITTTYSYGPLGRVLRVEYGGQVSVTYAYDRLGRRTAMSDATGLTEYGYDALGRTLLVSHSVGATLQYTVGYAYDGRGLRTGLFYPDGSSAAYGYDLAGRLITVSAGLTASAAYGLDAGGRVISLSLGNGISAHYDYDGADQVTELSYRRGEELLARYVYSYDALGQLIRSVETVVGAEGAGGQLGGGLVLEVPAIAPRTPGEILRASLPFAAERPGDDSASWPLAGVAAVQLPPELEDPELWLPGELLQGPPQGRVVRERAHFKASFDEQGLRYSPKTSLLEAGEYHLDFHLLQVSSGRHKFFQPGAAQLPPVVPAGRKELVRYDRGEIFSEEYLVSDGGIEQRFVFPQPLELDGDLEIEANLSGNLQPVLNEASGEIQLLTPRGEAVASYGRAIVEDAAGQRLVAGMELEGKHLRIVVPEQWLKEALYPVVLDPLIGPNFALSTQAIAGHQQRSALASAADGSYLVAWYGAGSGSDVYAQVVAAGGMLVSETIVLDDRAFNQRYPDVAANVSDTEYLVVWQAEDWSGFWSIYGQLVDGTGARSGERIAISSGSYNQLYPAVAGNASEGQYLVVWESYDSSERLYGIYGQLLDGTGTPEGETITIATSEEDLSYPDVTFNISDTEYLVVWQQASEETARDIWGRIVPADGEGMAPAFAINEDPQDQSVPAVTYSISDSRYLVAWQSYTTTGSSNDIHAQLVGRDGSLPGSRIDVATGSDQQYAPDVTYGDQEGEYLVSWEQTSFFVANWDVYGQRLDGNGGTVGGVITIYSGSYNQRYPALAYDESAAEYLAIWQDYRSGSSWDVYGLRLTPAGGSTGEEILISAEVAGGAQERAAVAYGAVQELYLVVWEDDQGGSDDIYGQLVTGEGALVGDPLVIAGSESYHERAPAVAYDPGSDRFLVVWEQYPLETGGEDSWNVYGQWVEGDGDTVGGALAIGSASGDQRAPALAYNAAAGYFLVAWEDDRASWDIYARALTPEKAQDEFVVYDGTAGIQRYPDVAADEENGEYLVVWQEGEEQRYDVYGRRTNALGALGLAFSIAADEERVETNPAVSFSLSDTRYLVLWQEGEGEEDDIRGRLVSSAGGLLDNELSVAVGEALQQYPDLAWDASSGDYAVVWQEGASSPDIRALLLDGAGLSLDDAETVSAAGNAQERPAIAYDSTLGRFLVAWEDHRHSTDNPDIYGQLYRGYRGQTLVVDYAYDPLGRMVEADYSNGVHYDYAYNALGSRTVVTSVTPLSGTVVTANSYDAAGRLSGSERSDGRAYTYTWSLRNELLAEETMGYDVRTFSYDAAGRMTRATLFTQTTYFTYAGDGTRVAVEVEGQGTTRYIPDYTRRWRVLLEQTATTATLYLYGQQCLGERREGQWLFHLLDGTGYVRQVANEEGRIEGAWLFDPDGTLLEGPEGPVSHLICGGIYDRSTGLLYKGGRYFDPGLGIYLALGPLSVFLLWQERRKGKKRRRGFPWYVLAVLLTASVGGMVAGCEQCDEGSPTPTPITVCTERTDSSYVAYGFVFDGFTEEKVQVLGETIIAFANKVGGADKMKVLMEAINKWKPGGGSRPIECNPSLKGANAKIELGWTVWYPGWDDRHNYSDWGAGSDSDAFAQIVLGHEIGHNLVHLLGPDIWIESSSQGYRRHVLRYWDSSPSNAPEEEAVTNLALDALGRGYFWDMVSAGPEQDSERIQEIQTWLDNFWYTARNW